MVNRVPACISHQSFLASGAPAPMRGPKRKPCLLACVLWLLLPAFPAKIAASDTNPQFNRDVRPILSENCFFCHGADAQQRQADLRLDLASPSQDPAILSRGQPGQSELLRRIRSRDPADRMPPPDSHRELSASEIQTLERWIHVGAPYQQHWAFQPPRRPPLPKTISAPPNWPRNPIDTFVLAKLQETELSPNPPAPLESFWRRASLDLTGLPPTPTQMDRWRHHPHPREAAVDDLLASPQFGERMAVDWMDVARYADTHGFNNDSQRSMWRWRDWVVDAFNRNLPYDQFISEQLAGDLLPHPTPTQRLATGFNRNHVINSEGGIIDEEYRVEYVADRVQTTALAWMAVTLSCARCHDHKFDPVSQEDYYRFFAFFNQVDEYGEDGRVANASPFLPTPTPGQQRELRRLQTQLQQHRQSMDRRLQAQTNQGLTHHSLSSLTLPPASPALPSAATNILLSLDLSRQTSNPNQTPDVADLDPWKPHGALQLTAAPMDHSGLRFNGANHLEAASFPKYDASQGWTFAAWVRRDAPQPGPLFSTMRFDVPPSSQSYGHGTELRLTQDGAVEVRLSKRWPAYAVQLVTHESIPLHEWRRVRVNVDNSAKAQGVRVFLDGQECRVRVHHDDAFSLGPLAGQISVAKSDEPDTPRFVGALADVTWSSDPMSLEEQTVLDRLLAMRWAQHVPDSQRGDHHTRLLREAWMKHHDPEYAQSYDAWKQARRAWIEIHRQAPTTMIMRELPEPRPTFFLARGQYDQPRQQVSPGVPEFLLPFPDSAPLNRLGLAQWLTHPDHPLTARVVVNRFWQSLFGTGLVKTVEDFGYQSEWPSHPQLLDWLAVEFVESGWDVKHLLRLIVTSAVYGQDAHVSPEKHAADPENRWLSRGPRQRLTAEMLRDQALAVSGLLQHRLGGPPVFPYQPTNLYQGIVVGADYPGTTYVESKGADLYRRSLYTFWKRTVPHPTLATFDAPDREFCQARRLRTNTPLQALALMNDTIQVEASRHLGQRMLLEAGPEPEDRLRHAFVLATSRTPTSAELSALLKFLETRLHYYHQHPAEGPKLLQTGASPSNTSLDSAKLAAYANVASLILNLDETIHRP